MWLRSEPLWCAVFLNLVDLKYLPVLYCRKNIVLYLTDIRNHLPHPVRLSLFVTVLEAFHNSCFQQIKYLEKKSKSYMEKQSNFTHSLLKFTCICWYKWNIHCKFETWWPWIFHVDQISYLAFKPVDPGEWKRQGQNKGSQNLGGVQLVTLNTQSTFWGPMQMSYWLQIQWFLYKGNTTRKSGTFIVANLIN